MDLQGTRALLTGASGGLGGHIARALTAEGVCVVLSGRAVARLEELAAELPGSSVVPADIAEAREAAALFERAEAAAGPIDLLVNNAGLEGAVAYHEMDDAEIERMVAVNVVAAMLLSRHALARMLERRRGHVVNMSSIAGKGGTAYDAAYATTKAALVGLTRSLRLELADTPVGASVICPGFVERDGMYASIEALGVRAPLPLRPVAPEKVAAAVVNAVRRDQPEVWVTGFPLRPLGVLVEAVPRLGERVIGLVGARGFLRDVATRRGVGARSPNERSSDEG